MKLVFTAATVTEVHLVRGILESEGIEVMIKNEHLAGLAGEIPFFNAWPEVWVVRDEEAGHAERLLKQYRQGS